jgi:hypothetical protein
VKFMYFMYWGYSPCFVDDHLSDGALAIVAPPSPLLLQPGWHLPTPPNILGTRRTWDALFSHNIARAYRPEVP